MLGKSISQNSLILGTFAAVTAGLIASTFMGTQERIAEAERRAAQKALFEIVPPSRHNNDLLNETLELGAAASDYHLDSKAHVAKYNGEPVAMVFKATAPDGYSGDIRLLIGVNLDGQVTGVRVLSHKETPGLGDKIDLSKSEWILSFQDKSLNAPDEKNWKVKKDGGDFDQFTGATITPRAVVQAVKQALLFYRDQPAVLMDGKRP